MRSLLSKKLDVFWALAAVALLAIAVLAMALATLAARADADAREHEAAVINRSVRDRIDHIASSVPNVVWDDAVVHIDNRFDRNWVHNNIGRFFHAAEGFEYAYVLDASDRPIYAMVGGEEAPTARFADIAHAAAAQIASVRSREVERLASGGAAPLEALRDRIQSSSVRVYEGKLYVVTASLVQPDFGAARIRHARAPIVVSGRPLDVGFATDVADQHLLNDVQLVLSPATPAPYESSVPILDDAGQTLAYYVWTPRHPGAMLLASMGPVLAILLAALFGWAMVLFHRAQRFARAKAATEARLNHLAFHDGLTGLANRLRVEERLKHLSAQGEEQVFALHCIDLDRFKEVNDTFGHTVGDELIREAAKRILALCRPTDIAARLGGDEFAVIQMTPSREGAASLSSRILRALNGPFLLSVGSRQLSASVGVTMSDGAVAEPLEWLRQADLALYAAKGAGRACVRFFDAEMDAAQRERSLLGADLQHALATGALDVVYQPQVDRAGAIIGVEALARWTHPQKGPISPSIFVPLAEETGLMNTLGDLVLERVFEDSFRWPHLKIAINVSACQIQSPDFLERLDALVASKQVKPSRFELELTESLLLDESGQTREKLLALRGRGFSIALDDFGTGYSSLSYIQHFPINKIKIDRSFVTNLGVKEEAQEVVGAIVKLARALRLSVIAEGVETSEQWLRLQAVGCTEIQGYVASAPLSVSDISDCLVRSEEVRSSPSQPHAFDLKAAPRSHT